MPPDGVPNWRRSRRLSAVAAGWSSLVATSARTQKRETMAKFLFQASYAPNGGAIARERGELSAKTGALLAHRARRGGGAQKARGIDRLAVSAHFVMEMGAGRANAAGRRPRRDPSQGRERYETFVAALSQRVGLKGGIFVLVTERRMPKDRAMETPAANRPPQQTGRFRRIGFLVFQDCEILDVSGPFEAFFFADHWLARLGRGEPGYQSVVIAAAPGTIRTMSGMEIVATHGYSEISDG